MKTYEKKPETVHAIQITEENQEEIADLVGVRQVGANAYAIEMPNGSYIAGRGDWLCVDPIIGAYSVMPDHIFQNTYKELDHEG